MNEKMNREQENAVEAALSGENIFLSGGAGTGKTTVLKAMIDALETDGKQVLVCAPTGMAASLIGGTTIHSLFGFPTGSCLKKNGSPIARTNKVTRSADVIVIDETSMIRCDQMDAIIASINKAEKDSGKKKQIIVCGDFFQLPPVIAEPDVVSMMKEFYRGKSGHAFDTPQWNEIFEKAVILKDVHRQADPEFAQMLSRLRVGDSSCIKYFMSKTSPEKLDNAINLYLTNKDADAENMRQLMRIPGEISIFKPIYIGKTDIARENDFAVKTGARVVFTANDRLQDHTYTFDDYTSRGGMIMRSRNLLYNNGDMGTVEYTGDYEIHVRLDRTGRKIVVFPQEHNVYEYETTRDGKIVKNIVGQCIKMPLRLGYAVTVHKAQGSTYDRVNVILHASYRNWYMQPGQLYVGLSRCREVKNMYIDDLDPGDFRASVRVQEFYRRIGQ